MFDNPFQCSYSPQVFYWIHPSPISGPSAIRSGMTNDFSHSLFGYCLVLGIWFLEFLFPLQPTFPASSLGAPLFVELQQTLLALCGVHL